MTKAYSYYMANQARGRHHISNICKIDKEIIILPNNLAHYLTDPHLIELLNNHKNAILIIEDADNILIKREGKDSNAVSSLLNITDGLFSDLLNIQVICTFNTDLSNIDPALLRKGRLIAKYEFNALEKEKAQKLSDKLGFNAKIDKPLTLADIYNQEHIDYQDKPIKVGYKND